MTKTTRDRLDKIEDRIFTLERLWKVYDTPYYQESQASASIIMFRIEQIYNHLGVERIEIPAYSKLEKIKKP